MSDNDTGLVFVIDGNEYPGPSPASFTMAELRVMYDLSGIVREDFVQGEDESDDEHDARVRQLTRHPGFMESLMHIAYQRGNPGMRRDKVQAVIEQTNFLDAIERWGDDGDVEDDPAPLPVTSEPDEPSSNGSLGNETMKPLLNDSGGTGSGSGSDEQEAIPSPIGGSRSDTSRTSPRETLRA